MSKTLKLVDENFKPKQSLKGIKERKLLDEIEELKERLEEEIKRIDELRDELEKFERNNHDDYEVIPRYEFEDIKRDEGILDDLNSIMEEIEITKWKKDVGIVTANDDLNDLYEQLQELKA